MSLRAISPFLCPLEAATGLRLRTLLLLSRLPRRLEHAYGHLPLGEADQLVVHQSSQPFQDLLAHEPEDAYWKPTNWSGRMAEVQAPAYLMAGWYDLFLDWQLKDYQALRRAGKQPSLLVGPWTHVSAGLNGMLIRETLAWVEIVLEVDDVHLSYEHVKSCGYPIEGPLQKRHWGLTDFRLVDPDGYYLRITSRA